MRSLTSLKTFQRIYISHPFSWSSNFQDWISRSPWWKFKIPLKCNFFKFNMKLQANLFSFFHFCFLLFMSLRSRKIILFFFSIALFITQRWIHIIVKKPSTINWLKSTLDNMLNLESLRRIHLGIFDSFFSFTHSSAFSSAFSSSTQSPTRLLLGNAEYLQRPS